MKKILLLAATFMATMNISAQDDTVQPFIELDQMPNLLEIMPAPPAFESPEFANDVVRYGWGKQQRRDEACDQSGQQPAAFFDRATHAFERRGGLRRFDRRFQFLKRGAAGLAELNMPARQVCGRAALRLAEKHLAAAHAHSARTRFDARYLIVIHFHSPNIISGHTYGFLSQSTPGSVAFERFACVSAPLPPDARL